MLEEASAADLPAVAALMNLAFRGGRAEAGWSTEAAYIDGDRTSEAMLAADLASQPEARLLVIRSGPGGSIEACVWIDPAGGGAWHLGSLTVHPRLQDTGVGRRLLAAAETRARELGAIAIRMEVVNVRETLIAWYVRRGYRLTGATEPFPYDDHRFGVPRRSDLRFLVLEKML